VLGDDRPGGISGAYDMLPAISSLNQSNVSTCSGRSKQEVSEMNTKRFVTHNVRMERTDRDNSICLIIPVLLVCSLFTACNGNHSSSQNVIDTTSKIIHRTEVMNKARTTGQVNVLVIFTTPEIEQLTTESRRYQTVTPGNPPSQEAQQADEKLAAAIAATTTDLLDRLQGTTYTERRCYRTVPLVALSVAEDALLILETLPQVVRIEEDQPVPVMSTSGV
jgi:hypothetical protein